jgi:hypothetical protein
VIGLPRGVSVYAFDEPCDMRKSFDTLTALVTEHMQHDVLTGCGSRVNVDSQIDVMWTLGSAPCGHRDRRRGQRDRRPADSRIASMWTAGSPVRTAVSPARGQRDRGRGRLDRRVDT